MIGRKKRTDDTTAPSDPVGHLSGSTDAELFSNMVAGIHYHVGMSVFITQIKTAMQNLLQAGEPNFKRCMRADEDTFIFLKKWLRSLISVNVLKIICLKSLFSPSLFFLNSCCVARAIYNLVLIVYNSVIPILFMF